MQEIMIKKAETLFSEGKINRALGWKKGEFCYDVTPAVFADTEAMKKDFVFGDFCGANFSKYLVEETRKDGKVLDLTQREFDLICYLAAQPGTVFSREALMEHVWNYEGYVGDVRAVDVAVRRLREKIEDDPAAPKFILTKRGMGYFFGG